MKSLSVILVAQCVFLTGCCFMDPEEFENGCDDQVFEETKQVPLESVYTLNTTSTFLEANTLTASQIQNALKVEGNDFTIKRIEITSAQVAYRRLPDNTSAALFVNTAVVGNTFSQLLLLKENLLLPLIDIPGTLFTDPLNINEFLNGQAIKDFKKILLDYATIINDEGISFILTGNPSPAGTTANFELKFKINLSIVYEVCRYAPIGEGIRSCE
jgi:hypothetical protein